MVTAINFSHSLQTTNNYSNFFEVSRARHLIGMTKVRGGDCDVHSSKVPKRGQRVGISLTKGDRLKLILAQAQSNIAGAEPKDSSNH